MTVEELMAKAVQAAASWAHHTDRVASMSKKVFNSKTNVLLTWLIVSFLCLGGGFFGEVLCRSGAGIAFASSTLVTAPQSASRDGAQPTENSAEGKGINNDYPVPISQNIVEILSNNHLSQLKLKETFKECPNCPEMVTIRAGTFEMGSSIQEETSAQIPNFMVKYERPQHSVALKTFAIGKYLITKEEFSAFISETGKDLAGCKTHDGDTYRYHLDKNWRDPGFDQTDRHPAVCVNWDDAQNYISWLNSKIKNSTTGNTDGLYRLPTEAEMEYATRAGTTSAWFWGDDVSAQCDFANAADVSTKDRYPDLRAADCRDGYYSTAPVGSFQPNPWNLYYMVGNAFQWTADCRNYNYVEAPSDGSAWLSGDCTQRILRGSAWASPPIALRSASRTGRSADERYSFSGFRVARSLQ